MVEVWMGNDLAEDQLGADWIRAIMEGAFERLEGFCQADITSTLLTPGRSLRYENASDLAAKFRQWFGKCSDFHLEHSRVEPVGERLGIFYRFYLHEHEDWLTVEQQLYCTLEAGKIVQMQVLCSGFQPALESGQASGAETGADSLLELYSAAGGASTCALLTPAIKARLREMQPGQVLEVRVDDTSARGDIEAWCRLSGNPLVRMVEDPGEQELRFFVRKK